MKLPGGQRASVGQRAERLSLDVAFLLPFLEVPESGQFGRVLHPLDHLQHGDEVDVVAVQHFIDELDEFVLELFLALEPRGLEVEAERGAVGVQVAVEVVAQQTAELLAGLDVGTRVDHVTTGQRFVESWVITTIQFVHDHLPDGVAAAGAVLGVTCCTFH